MATKYTSALTGPQMDKALLDMNNHISEAWAVGERDGVPVTMSDETYNNNAKFYSDRSAHYADIASRANIPTGDPAVRYDLEQQLTESEKLQARTNIGVKYSNPNLLDNPFFTINQRNATSANNGYGVDRWRGNYDVNADGSITIRQFAIQYADYPLNVPITMSAIYGDDNAVISGTLTLTDTTTQKYFVTNGSVIQLVRNSSNAFMVWTGTTCKVKAVKLELGSASTLANDSAPKYAEEVVRCKSHYWTNLSQSFAYVTSGMIYQNGWVSLIIPNAFASAPTIETVSTLMAHLPDGATYPASGSVNIDSWGAWGVRVAFNTNHTQAIALPVSVEARISLKTAIGG